ncbi:MAG: ABC transporter ATP-binding protein [Lentisphaerae bacterium]|nr:ABC transporter ATP-binding protein [Lentisphaerota bacterium]
MIEVAKVAKTYRSPAGERMTVLAGVSLRVERGEMVALLGPSGCGKTTLLNLAAGFDAPDAGTIRIGGERVRGPSPRRITVFQQGGLLPWRTVRGNVELGLESLGWTKARRQERVDACLRLVELLPFAEHHPRQLSGGMQQRVAVARALAVEPDVLFLDEPFSALDAPTRAAMQGELLRLRQRLQATILLVTHDLDEAIVLADRILVLSSRPGTIRGEFVPTLTHPRQRDSAEYAALREDIADALEPAAARPEWSI